MGSATVPPGGAELICDRRVPSPNFGPRRDGLRPELVVLHHTAMADAQSACDRLCDPEAEVSAHYLITRDGALWSLVDEDARAWHAGAGQWRGMDDINSRSIGIELDNDGASPFSERLMRRLEDLLTDILAQWSIPSEGVIGHSDMAPDRKFDPGRRFDWRRLALGGLSVWPEGETEDVGPEAFLPAAHAFGYSAEAPPEAVLDAFRQRFRPWARGPVTTGDAAAARSLARRFGIDRAGFRA